MAENFAVFAVACDRFVPGGTIREGENGVVGACVSVDRDTIKSVLDGILDGPFKASGMKFGVSGHEAKHGGHVGVDHPGSFGASADADAGSVEIEGDREFLFVGVAGDNGLGDVIALLIAEASNQAVVVGINPAHGERKPNDPCRADGDFPLFEFETFGRFPCHITGIFHPIRPGASVGIAAIGDYRADRVGTEVAFGHPNRCGFDPVLGEHPL